MEQTINEVMPSVMVNWIVKSTHCSFCNEHFSKTKINSSNKQCLTCKNWYFDSNMLYKHEVNFSSCKPNKHFCLQRFKKWKKSAEHCQTCDEYYSVRGPGYPYCIGQRECHVCGYKFFNEHQLDRHYDRRYCSEGKHLCTQIKRSKNKIIL